MDLELPIPELSRWRCWLPPLPKRQSRGRAIGLCAGAMVGVTLGSGWRETPCWWPDGSPATVSGGAHKHFVAVRAGGVDIAGYWTRADGSAGGALGWQAQQGGLRLRELHPPHGWELTRALGAGGGCIAGYGQPKVPAGGRAQDRALCWQSDGNLVELPALEPGSETLAHATDGSWAVGWSGNAEARRAVLWSLAGHSVLRLGAPHSISEACGVADGQQVGYFWAKSGARAALWRGTAESLVDLTPAGFADARALACAAGCQVGVVTRERQTRSGGASSLTRAALWAGSAQSWLDLQALLPSPWNSGSAVAICVSGDKLRVVGEAQQVVIEAEGTRQERSFVAAQVPAIWEVRIA